MKKIIRFSKFFPVAAILSTVVLSAGIVSWILMGVNLGVDFQAGIIQEVQFAPTAFRITWSGRGNASIRFDRNNMYIVNYGVGVESLTITFPFSEYETVGALTEAMISQVEGLQVELIVPEEISTQWLVRSAQGDPQLGVVPFLVHYLDPQSDEIPIARVREAMSSLGQTFAVQSLGERGNQRFMIRLDDKKLEPAVTETETETETAETETGETFAVDNQEREDDASSEDGSEGEAAPVNAETETETGETLAVDSPEWEDNSEEAPEGEAPPASTAAVQERITKILEESFGDGEVVILRSDFVDSRFSKNLTDQVGYLVALTLLLIFGYSAIRFKPKYALGAVIGIMHDAIVVVAFVVWTRMEFNTTTIAAILTILGYSINNTIVVFDRLRENTRILPDEKLVALLDRSLTETLSRTIITTFTTMLAVASLFIFTTGSMKEFALTLIVGMISGVYTTLFIVTCFVAWSDKLKIKKRNPAQKTGSDKAPVSRA